MPSVVCSPRTLRCTAFLGVTAVPILPVRARLSPRGALHHPIEPHVGRFVFFLCMLVEIGVIY